MKNFEEHLNENQDNINGIKYTLSELRDSGINLNLDTIGGRIVISYGGHTLFDTNNNAMGLSSSNIFLSGILIGSRIEKTLTSDY